MTAKWVIILAMGLCGGCSAVIVPPAAAARGTTVPVHVADYGYHSTIILPKSDGGLVEYAYGDWDFFGLSHKSFGTALRALFASDQATLGRRVLDREPDQPGLEDATGAKRVLRFEAPRDRVEDLERVLEQRFCEHLDSIEYSPVHHLYFVKDGERYGVAHNCNHFTAQWLERLGCRVEGTAMLSNFQLRENGVAAPADSAPPVAVVEIAQPPASRSNAAVQAGSGSAPLKASSSGTTRPHGESRAPTTRQLSRG
jgi:hypothetical protein